MTAGSRVIDFLGSYFYFQSKDQPSLEDQSKESASVNSKSKDTVSQKGKRKKKEKGKRKGGEKSKKEKAKGKSHKSEKKTKKKEDKGKSQSPLQEMPTNMEKKIIPAAAPGESTGTGSSGSGGLVGGAMNTLAPPVVKAMDDFYQHLMGHAWATVQEEYAKIKEKKPSKVVEPELLKKALDPSVPCLENTRVVVPPDNRLDTETKGVEFYHANYFKMPVCYFKPAGLRQPTAVVCLSKLSVSTCGNLLPTTACGGPRD